nr:MAG TPA: minor tail protein [Caudoviricetes sp.]
MDDWAKSADGVTAKIEAQEKIVDAEKKKLDLLKQQLERLNQSQEKGKSIIADLTAKHQKAIETYGASSDEAKKYAKQLLDAQSAQNRNAKAADDLNTKILNQDTTVKKAERELEKYHGALDEIKGTSDYLRSKQERLTTEYKKAAKEYGRNSTEAKALKGELKDVSGQLKNVEKSTEDTSDATKEFTGSMEKVGDGFSVAKGAIADFVGNALSKLASSIGDAITGVAGLADETREYRTIMGSLENSSQRAGYSTEETAETFKQLNGVLGDTQSAATTTANLQAIGLEQGKLENLTNSVIGAWAKYGDSIPIDGLAEATNETIKVGQVTGTFADALNWAQMSTDDYREALSSNDDALTAFNKSIADGEAVEDAFSAALGACTDQTQRADIVTQTFTKMGLDKAGEAWQKNNQSIVDANNAQADYEQSTAELGETIEPITTKIKEGFGRIVEKVAELVKKADFSKVEAALDAGFSFFVDTVIPKIEDGINFIVSHKDDIAAFFEPIGSLVQTAFTFLIDTVFPAIQAGFGWLVDHKDEVLAAVAGVAAAFVAFNIVTIIQGVVSAFTTLVTVIRSVGVAQAALNVIMSLNPVGLIVAGIAALIAIFVVLWNRCDGFREFWINLWDKIKEIASVTWDAISGFFSAAWDTIKGVWDTVQPYFEAIWGSIKAVFAVVIDVLAGYFSMAWNNIKIVWDVVTGYFKMVWNNIKLIFSVVKKVLSGDFSGAWDAIKKIWNNVKTYFSSVWNGIKGIFSNVTGFFKEHFTGAYNAIKNVFNGIGEFFSGIWENIKSVFTGIGEKVADAIGSAFKSVINGALYAVENAINLIPNALNGALDVINKLPGVNIPSVPTVSLPRLAKGGIVDKSTLAEIGENGTEAVIPLEKNKGGLKKIASLLSEEMGGGKAGGGISGGDKVYNFTQNIYSPKPLSRYDVYRDTKNLLNTVKSKG